MAKSDVAETNTKKAEEKQKNKKERRIPVRGDGRLHGQLAA